MLPATHTVPGGSLCLAVTEHVLAAQGVTGQGVVLAVCLLAQVHLAVVPGQVRGRHSAVTKLLVIQELASLAIINND